MYVTPTVIGERPRQCTLLTRSTHACSLFHWYRRWRTLSKEMLVHHHLHARDAHVRSIIACHTMHLLICLLVVLLRVTQITQELRVHLLVYTIAINTHGTEQNRRQDITYIYMYQMSSSESSTGSLSSSSSYIYIYMRCSL